MKKDVFEIDDIDLAASALYAAVRGSEYQFAHHSPPANIQKYIETLMNMVFKGIEK